MSQYQGSSNRVRCIDCARLSETGKRCLVKNIKVAYKKRRICPSYEFKGEFVNRKPLESVYLPPVDKKTAKMIRKLMRMGVIPVADEASVKIAPDGQILQRQHFEMPKSTATASVVGMKSNEDAVLSNPNKLADSEEETAIWAADATVQEEEHGDCR